MPGLTEKEIKEKLSEAVEVGQGKKKGLLVHEVHNGHIVNTYFEHRQYPKKGAAGHND